jgi:GT2 family glycosyltransferase
MRDVAIVIVSYNSLFKTTKPCIESIYNAKTKIDFEVIVVDNFSTDETRNYLKDIEGKYKNYRFILNERNHGFPKGNNIGIRATNAEYYVLLNSDTIVSDYWIDNMIMFMGTHKEVGMSGPVSNSVWNAQKIMLEDVNKSEESIIESGVAYAKKYKNDFFYCFMLGFFCVMIRNEVVEKVGLLDDAYGIGTFEDDDYCLRVLQKGYKLACLEGVVIYHKGSISFKNTNLTKIMKKNRALFEKRFNTKWINSYRPETFIDCISQYLVIINTNNVNRIKELIQDKLKIVKSFYENEYELQNKYSQGNWKAGNLVYFIAVKTGISYLPRAVLVLKKYGIKELYRRIRMKL